MKKRMAEDDAEPRESSSRESKGDVAKSAASTDAKAKRPRPPPHPSVRQTFAPCRWLSDEAISYAYSRLSGDADGDSCGSEGGKLSEDVLLIDPPTAFWLALQTELKDREEARKALKVLERKLVLCPINDNRDGGAVDAGTHWGLLVWDRRGSSSSSSSTDKVGQFIYYDSGFCHMQKSHDQAQQLSRHLAGQDVPMQVGSCPKQTNSFDCGMYVIYLSELIVKSFLGVASAAGRELDARGPSSSTEPEPVWEARLAAVTPKEVADRRVWFYRTLSTMSAAAAAGA